MGARFGQGPVTNHPSVAVCRRASVAVLVLWAIALLAVFAIHIGAGVRQRLDFLARIESRHDLRWIARGGVEKALAALAAFENQDNCIALRQSWSASPQLFSEIPVGRGFATVAAAHHTADFKFGAGGDEGMGLRFGGEDEQAKLNLNAVPPQVLVRLFVALKALDVDQAEELAAAIVDWRDADNQSEAQGAEDAYYHGLQPASECKDGPFESLEELLQVRGMTAALWRRLNPYLTIYGSGAVNLNTASRPILAALGLSDSLQEKVLVYRCGEDGDPATADDRLFVNTTDIVALVSQAAALSASEATELSAFVSQGQLTTSSQTFLFQSTGRLPERQSRCLIQCVVEKSGSQIKVRQWRTSYSM